MSRLRAGGKWYVALVGVAALALAGGVAYATIPDTEGVIHACYKSNGALRVIDDSVTSCPKGETALDWNQQGLQGEQGETGEQGPEGPPGISGYVIVFGVEMVEPGSPGSAFADCPDGKKLLGGGGASHETTAVRVITSAPVGDDRWAFSATNLATVTVSLQAYAICAYVAE